MMAERARILHLVGKEIHGAGARSRRTSRAVSARRGGTSRAKVNRGIVLISAFAQQLTQANRLANHADPLG
jgi:hypothetical protein